MFKMVYAMNQNGWLALIICREKNLKSCNLQKQAFLANTQHQWSDVWNGPQPFMMSSGTSK